MCRRAGLALVLRTRDGGCTWHGIPAPRVRLAGFSGGGVSELRFADALNGWAFGPALWTTHDGGTHWRRVGVGAGVRALAASAGHAVAVVGSGPRYRVLRAPVGGDAWSSVASFRQADHDIVDGDLALSGASGWLVGRSSLYVTADGASWSKMPNPCRGFSGGGGGGAWLTSTTDGVVACAGQGAAGSEEKAIYGSSDGGHAFTLLGRPPRGGDFNAVAANRRNTVIVAAASGASTLGFGSMRVAQNLRMVSLRPPAVERGG